MISLYFQDKYPPPGIVSLTAVVSGTTRTSVNVSMELNNRGTVYCAAFDEGKVPTTGEEIVLQNHLGRADADFNGDGNFNSFVLINKLVPATT